MSLASSTPVDWFKLAYTVLGGLGLFFFGMKLLSESLQSVASRWIHRLIHSLTSHRLIAVTVGLTITAIVQSSSITTVMVVGFVNAGLMNLAQAIGVTMGANIGTTITGWMISIKVGKFSLLFIGLGVLPLLLAKNDKVRNWAKVLFAIGLVFLGLSTMSGAFKPLRTNPEFITMMTHFTADDYWSLLATITVGCLLTLVIQSSSAMLGITIALASTGAITFQTALALVFGENIGTTVTAILAGFGANTNARRAALAHATFNVLGALFISLIFWRYKDFIEGLISGPADFTNRDGQKPYIAAHIAAGHTIFNVGNVIVFLPFLNQLKKLVEWLVPEKRRGESRSSETLEYYPSLSPVLALEQLEDQLKNILSESLSLLKTIFRHLAGTAIETDMNLAQVKNELQFRDKQNKSLSHFMDRIMEADLSLEDASRLHQYLLVVNELHGLTGETLKMAEELENRPPQWNPETKNLVNTLLENVLSLGLLQEERGWLNRLNHDTTWNSLVTQTFNAEKKLRDHLLGLTPERQAFFKEALDLSRALVLLRRISQHIMHLHLPDENGTSAGPESPPPISPMDQMV